ncbi:MAG: hypothetical protein EAZ07_00825 [Cytophagales bacterium]|nr:MAG: hypothetical protein EAZ07_00825 [Cytophagales bacterium]
MQDEIKIKISYKLLLWIGIFITTISNSYAQFSICIDRTDSIPIIKKEVRICLGSTATVVAKACNVTNNSETYTYTWTNINETYITVNSPKFLIQEAGKYEIAVKARTSNQIKYDTITVSYQSRESFKITPSAPVKCKNDKLVLKANTSGFKNYRWRLLGSNTLLNSTDSLVNPTANKEYIVSAISPNGCKIDSNIYIIQAPSIFEPTINLGPKDTAICEGKPLRLKNLLGNKYTHLWSIGSRDTAITINSVGKYWLNVKTEICSATDTIVVRNSLSPVITERKIFYACFGKGTSLNLNIKGDTNAFQYQWLPSKALSSNRIKTPIASPTENTSYTLRVSAPGGCFDTATVKVFINPKLEINIASKDTVLCGGASLQLLTKVSGGKPFLDPNNKYNYSWSPNNEITNPTSPSPTVKPTKTTIFKLKVTDSAQCSDTATTEIKVYQLRIEIDTLNKSNFCIQDTVSVRAKVITNSPSYEFVWRSQLSKIIDSTKLSPQFILNKSGSEKLTAIAKDQSGCTVKADLSFNINKLPTVSIPLKYRRICFGDSVQILATASGGSGINYGFSWSPINTGIYKPNTSNPMFIGNQEVVGEKKYKVRVTDSFGCKSQSDSITIETIPFFVANLGGIDTSTCKGDSIKLFPSSPIPPSFTYNWVNASTGTTIGKNTFIIVKETGLYQLKVEDAQSGCSNKVSKQVYILEPPINPQIIAPIQACTSDSILLIAKGILEKSKVVWTSKNGGIILSPENDTTLYFPSKEIKGNAEIKATISNLCGKKDTSFFIQLLPSPQLKLSANPQESFIDSLITFSNSTSLNETLNWNFRDGSPNKQGQNTEHRYSKANNYTIIAFTARPLNGCPAIDSIRITVLENQLITELFIPNVFAPSASDRDNQTFKIFGKNISNQNFNFIILNRWSEIIFQTNDLELALNKGWSGTNTAGQLLESGNYTFILKGIFKDGVPFNKYGNVTLLR